MRTFIKKYAVYHLHILLYFFNSILACLESIIYNYSLDKVGLSETKPNVYAKTFSSSACQ